MTLKEQIKSALLTSNALDQIHENIHKASETAENLQCNINGDGHPKSVAALEALQWHLAAAHSLGAYVGKLNGDYGCEGKEALAQQLAHEAAAEDREPAGSADGGIPSHTENEAILERLGIRDGTVVVVRISEDKGEREDFSSSIH